MKFTQSLQERRTTLGRMTLALINKPTSLTKEERERLSRIQIEMNDLEDDLRFDGQRKYGAAFKSLLRNGPDENRDFRGVTSEERRLINEHRDQSTAGLAAYPGMSNLSGAALVPMDFYDKVTSALKFYAPILDVCSTVDTLHGAPLPFPTDNDTTVSGALVAENAQTPAADIAGLSATNLGAYKYSSNFIRCSRELVNDAAFDLEGYLADRFAVRIARALGPHLTTGTGIGQPTGVIAGATLGATAAGAGTNDGTSGANTIGSDDISALEASLDAAYRPRAVFMCSPSTLQSLKNVKDKQGRPVFPGLQSGGRDQILNRDVVLNPSMDQLQANAGSPPVTRKTMLIGDFSQYRVRRVRPMVQRLYQRFIDFGQIGFVMWARFDGALIDGGGGSIKYLANVY